MPLDGSDMLLIPPLPAGEYPSTLAEATPEVHVSGALALHQKKPIALDKGDPTGLYHLILGQGQNVFVANGKVVRSYDSTSV